jgi:hypothetical protein
MDGNLGRPNLNLERHRQILRVGTGSGQSVVTLTGNRRRALAEIALVYSVARSALSRDRMVGFDASDMNGRLDHIKRHIEQALPPDPLFNIDVIEATV